MQNGTDSNQSDEGERSDLRAIIERYEGAPNQCTIFPGETARSERLETWITAKEPAFVDLRSVR